MKTPPVKAALSWLLIGVLAAVSFAGPSLHSILGFHHCGVFGHVGNAPVGASDASSFSQSPEKVVVRSLSSANGDSDEANCPVCNYLAQAKIAGDHVDFVVSSIVIANETFIPEIQIPSPALRPFEARGPPAAV